MKAQTKDLDWLDTQQASMTALLEEWSNINSHSYNRAGLAEQRSHVKRALEPLGGEVQELELPDEDIINEKGTREKISLGNMLLAKKRSEAPIQILLGIHMDTVYPISHPFQSTEWLDENTLRGPGVTDAKGGLVIMLRALEAFERSNLASRVGWELFVNPDEEIGSPGSTPILKARARHHQAGLVFEPALPDGNLVGERSGTGRYTMVIRGRSAHAGREPENGRNAINALAECITELAAFDQRMPGTTINVGKIEGGGPVNVVPDLALLHMGIRVAPENQMADVRNFIDTLASRINERDGLSAELHHGFLKPPKRMTASMSRLVDAVVCCGREINLSLEWRRTAGASDGNTLAAAGLPTIDSLGPRGGQIHSSEEFVKIDSLVERAKLTTLFLLRVASGEITLG